MPLKFYLHAAASGNTGTLPAANVSVSGLTPAQTPALTNRSMDDTIGVAQASVSLTTLANTAAQSSPIGRWLSSPLAEQTLANQNLTFDFAGSESNTNSNFGAKATLTVWRPSTGAVVGQVWIGTNFLWLDFTAQTVGSITTGSSTPVTTQAGDILVLEIWRGSDVQGMGTAYTNTIYYNGTTEGSATTNAAYLLFTNDVAMQAAAANPRPIRTSLQAVNRASSY